MNTFLRTFVDTSNFPIIQAVLAHLFVFTYFSIIQNFKIILSFFHNRNEGKMFVHPVTHDAHGLALKKESGEAGFSACGRSRKRHSSIPPQCDPRGAFFIVWKRSFLYDKKPCAEAPPKHRTSYSYFIGKPYSCTSTNIL